MLRDTQRLTQAELTQRIATAPAFVAGPVASQELDRLCRGYQAITGVNVKAPKKRAFLAATARTVGADFLDVVKARYAETGTETNLLADLRSGWRPTTSEGGKPDTAPSATEPEATEVPRPTPPSPEPRPADTSEPSRQGICGCPEADLIPGQIICSAHYEYNSAPKRRYDRRTSNPDAAGMFSDEEVAASQPSSTARALGR